MTTKFLEISCDQSLQKQSKFRYLGTTKTLTPRCSGYRYCTNNFIQQGLNSGSAQVQFLLAACRIF